ncbi:hypothetical protein [Gordonia sputi]|uniref:hypothetical protein n=1 Tax=Gordonia sputi TaxID=36823 RepID=UPI00226EA7BC|nr:hypothetical protein [Gordonia sputi]
MLDGGHIGEQAGDLVWPSQLSQVIERVEAMCELVCSGTHEHDRPILEAERVSVGQQLIPLGESTQPLLLVAIAAAQPNFPPHNLVRVCGKLVVGIGPQLSDGGAANGSNALYKRGVLGFVLGGGLDVVVEASEEVVPLVVRDVDGGDLHRA